jgi:hypothetical protein
MDNRVPAAAFWASTQTGGYREACELTCLHFMRCLGGLDEDPNAPGA